MAVDPILQTLSFCRKAGKLNFGFETVKNAVLSQKVFLLLTASDLSAKTIKEVNFLAQKNSLPCIALPYRMEEIALSIGKLTGVLAVTEQGFAKKIIKLNETEETHPYGSKK